MEIFISIFREHPLFKGLDNTHLRMISECAAEIEFRPGEYIYKEAEAAKYFYLIRRGKVALSIHTPGGEPIVIETLQGGELFGWSWAVPPYLRHFDAMAIEQTTAIILDGKCLRQKCEADLKLGYELQKRITYLLEKLLHSTKLQLINIYSHDSEER